LLVVNCPSGVRTSGWGFLETVKKGCMKAFWHTLKEEMTKEIAKKLVLSIASVLLFSLPALIQFFGGILFPVFPKELLLSGLLLSLIGCVVLGIMIHSSKNKIKELEKTVSDLQVHQPRNDFERHDYKFDEITGTFSKEGSEYKYCANCYYQSIESPLKVVSGGWQCMNNSCNNFFSNTPAENSTSEVRETYARWRPYKKSITDGY